MPAKVFISCGQGSPGERKVAQQLGDWFNSKGYHPYVAIEVQSILDLNAGIIGELKTSDYYLFINFRREIVTGNAGNQFHRGSLYTNQELAIAYAFGFDHMLLVNQKNSEKEGVFKFIVTNIAEFETHADVLPLIQNAVQKAGWQHDYTRQLAAANLRLAPPIRYGDHTGTRNICTLHVDIQNKRPDLGAVGCVARLVRFGLYLIELKLPFTDQKKAELDRCIGQLEYYKQKWVDADKGPVYLVIVGEVEPEFRSILNSVIDRLDHGNFLQWFFLMVKKQK